MIVPFEHVLGLSFILFSVGLLGVFTRKDAITIFLSVEIILNAANIAFVGFARAMGNELGHVAPFIVIAVAAAEAAVGLAIVIRLSQDYGTLNLDKIRELRG